MMQQPMMGQEYPPPGGYPPQQGGYPPQQGGYPPQQGGYPPQQGGYPPQQGGYPPQQGGYPQQPPMGGGPGGLGALHAASQIVLKQKVSLVEMAGDTMGGMCPCIECCLERPNDYEIFNEAGQKILHAKEESDFCWRCMCNPAQELKLEVTDMSGQQVMGVERPFKCCQQCPAWLPFCQQEATVTVNGAQIGIAQQPCCGGFFTPTVDVKLGTEDSPAFASVEGPMCCFGGMTEMCCDQNFQVVDGSGGEVGMITKERPESLQQAATELMSDSDLFTLKFTNAGAMKPDEKSMLLATVLLLDYMFFEQNQSWECDGSSCSITCCNMYICGALQPCKCSCSSGGEDENN